MLFRFCFLVQGVLVAVRAELLVFYLFLGFKKFVLFLFLLLYGCSAYDEESPFGLKSKSECINKHTRPADRVQCYHTAEPALFHQPYGCGAETGPQQSVERRRGPSPLEMSEDCHARLQTCQFLQTL